MKSQELKIDFDQPQAGLTLRAACRETRFCGKVFVH
jgi:hypothetical protein